MQIDPVINNINATVRLIVQGLRNKLTFEDNVQCSIVDVSDSGLANTAFTVSHNLGKVPKYYVWNIDRAGIVYDYSKVTWTATTMQLKCSVANAVLKLVVF